MIKILYVDDDKIDRMAFERFAKTDRFPYEYITAESLLAAVENLEMTKFDLVVSDYNLGDGVALDLLNHINDAPLIVITGLGNEEIAVKALKAGAYDYLIKDSEGNHFKILPVTIQNAINRKHSENQISQYKRNLERMVTDRTSELIFSNEKLQNEIAERRKIADALKLSEERFRLAMDAVNDGLWDWNLSTNEFFWSNNCYSMLGYMSNEFSMNLDNWFQLQHPDDRNVVWDSMQSQIQVDGNFEVEFRMISKKGTWVWIMSRGKPVLKDEEGNLLRMIGTHVNITDRKKYENEIVNLNEDLELKVSDRTSELNKTLDKLESSNLELKQLNESVSQDAFRLLQLNDKLAKSERELQALNKNLEKIVGERTRELSVAKNRAEEASRIKDIILNNLGHELRTPLNGILGFSDILEKDLTDIDQREMLLYIKESASRLHQTLNSLLILTELESHKIKINPQPCNVCELIQLYCATIKTDIINKGLSLDFNFKVTDSEAMIDEYFLYQILFNLLDNAIKFTIEGKIVIELDTAYFYEQNWIVIKIHDSGSGIKVEKLDTIFEPFRQESEGIDRHQEGLGLGLSITKKMVEILDGHIEISSELGIGTIVTIYFKEIDGVLGT